MSQNNLRIVSVLSGLSLLWVTGQVQSQTMITGPVTGTVHFINATTITLSNSNSTTSALSVATGETATAANGVDIKIDIQGDGANPTVGNYGLMTVPGGIIDFGNNRVIISDQAGTTQSKLATGILANGGTVQIGSDSQIHAAMTLTGSAISASGASQVTVGDGAELWGVGNEAISATGGANILIGDNASILNDGRGASLGSGDTNGSHVGVYVSNASIAFGAGSQIQTRALTSSHNNNGIHIQGTGQVTLYDGVGIATEGDHSYGILALGSSGAIVDGGQISVKTVGENSYAVVAHNSARVALGENSLLHTQGNSAHAINAQSGGRVTLDHGSEIKTEGNNTLGISTHGGAVVTAGNDVTVTTSGQTAYGLQSNGNGSTINMGDRWIFRSTDRRSRAAQTRLGGTIIIGTDADILTTGNESTGAYSNETNSLLQFGARARIETTGDSANGIGSGNGARMILGNNSTIILRGDLAIGAYSTGQGSETRLGSGTSVTTYGDQSDAIYAAENGYFFVGDANQVLTEGTQSTALYAYSNGGTIETGQNVEITTRGDQSYAVRAQPNTTVTLGNANTVLTQGIQAYGLVVNGIDARIQTGNGFRLNTIGQDAHGMFVNTGTASIGTGAVIETLGETAYGIYAMRNGLVELAENASIATSGNDAHAVLAEDGQVVLQRESNVLTSGQSSHGLFSLDGGRIDLQDAQIKADAGKGAHAIYATGQNASGQNAHIQGAGILDINGAIVAGDDGNIELLFRDGSRWTGFASTSDTHASNRLNLEGPDTHWTMTQDSTLSALLVAHASIDFTAAPLGTRLTTGELTAGASGSGHFVMKTDIAARTGDAIEVTGAASGSHQITVLNQGSDAVDGSEILPLVYTATEGGTFDLSGPVDVGAWRYGLRQQAGEAGWAKQWELYATGEISDPVSGEVNTFSGAYLLSDAETRTLIQRMGDLRGLPYSAGFWIRGYTGRFESGSRRYIRGFDMSYNGFQAGLDRQWNNVEQWHIYTGAMVGYADSDLDYGRSGKGEVDLKSLALYGTFMQDNGLYFDAVVKYMWMTNTFSMLDSAEGRVTGAEVDTHGVEISLEAGKRLALHPVGEGALYLEPQIQLSYTDQSSGYFHDSHGVQTHVDSFTSRRGRIGSLFGYETKTAVTPFNVYAKVSYLKEFDGDIAFTANERHLHDSFEGSRWLWGIGVTAQIDRHGFYMDIERSSGGNFDEPWAFKAGWRFSF